MPGILLVVLLVIVSSSIVFGVVGYLSDKTAKKRAAAPAQTRVQNSDNVRTRRAAARDAQTEGSPKTTSTTKATSKGEKEKDRTMGVS